MDDKSKNVLAVTCCVTAGYNYALAAQARAVAANLAQWEGGGHIIFATDSPETVAGAVEIYRELGDEWRIHVIADRFADNPKNYKEQAQFTIAQMRTAVFSKARALRADYTWSLDSDVLPPNNALRCMIDAVSFDSNFYSVATCPYPSQGGGGFLFGRGTPQAQICDDVYDDERTIPDELKARRDALHAELEKGKPSPELLDQWRQVRDEIKRCPAIGNVFELNAKGWRKRGWGEMAYPAIGKGAIVPTDWVGFGCTLMDKRALFLADFTGYEGRGTEDLFAVWRKWHPEGLKLAAIPHALCHHVVRKYDRSGYVLCYAYHETEGDCAGHIRLKHLPFYEMNAGEAYDPANDGNMNSGAPQIEDCPVI